MRHHRSLFLGLSLALVACGVGSSPTTSSSDPSSGGAGGGTGGSLAGGSPSTGGAPSGSGGTTGSFQAGGAEPDPTTCDSELDEDRDADGFTVAQGDCNDCDKNVNPGAIEVIGEPPSGGGAGTGGDGAGGYVPADEDCDGTADNPPDTECDDALSLNSSAALDGARAIELCKQAEGPGDWGVISADYVRASGTVTAASAAVGIQPNFGPNVMPRGGARMLNLSSGRARIPGQPEACGTLSCDGAGAGIAPAGFPQDVPGCAGATDINDDIGLQVVLRAPTNATGYSFNFKFYSFEYPEWVCTSFNDQFIALVNPAPAGSVNGNISFDSATNPVSVNIAFFDVCPGCPMGDAELAGTGFDVWNDAGATSWLQTTAPVTGGDEVTVRFAIWDTGDQAWDSSVLVDNFEWIANGGTVVVGTNPDIPE